MSLCSTATQAVVELPTTTREVTLTSQQPMSTNAKPDITPVFVHPLKPEVRIREHTTARYVKKEVMCSLFVFSWPKPRQSYLYTLHSSPVHSLVL